MQHSNRFFNVCCLFSQQFSAAYLIKLFLLPQSAHTTLFIRCDKPELTHWYLCSLHAGMQMSPDQVVGICDGCCHSIVKSTVDVPIRLFWQNFLARHCASTSATAGLTADLPHIWSAYVQLCSKCACFLLCFLCRCSHSAN